MDYEEQMVEQREKTLMFAGFKPEDLSDEQKDVILEPEEAPENYSCDGEITEGEEALLQMLRDKYGISDGEHKMIEAQIDFEDDD